MKVAIITNLVSAYREGFYDRLFQRTDVSVTVFCGKHIPGINLKSIHSKYPNQVKIVRAFIAKYEKIGFQFLPFLHIFTSYDVIFLDGNPRVLSNLIMSFLSKLFPHKKVVIWTMAHSYGANKYTERIRLWWTGQHKNLFVYTDNEVEKFRRNGWKSQHIVGMNNGLDQVKIEKEKAKWPSQTLECWKQSKKLEDSIVLLSVARLVPKNRFELVIKALPNVLKYFPSLKWVLIGSGPEEKMLKDLAFENGVLNNIVFEGALFEEKLLAPYFLSATVFVHPSSIGLSIMHAFGYGLPVIVDDDEYMHGPEYGAFENLHTGLNFERANATDLANVIVDLLNSNDKMTEMKSNVLKITREKYNVDIMVSRFIHMCKTCV